MEHIAFFYNILTLIFGLSTFFLSLVYALKSKEELLIRYLFLFLSFTLSIVSEIVIFYFRDRLNLLYIRYLSLFSIILLFFVLQLIFFIFSFVNYVYRVKYEKIKNIIIFILCVVIFLVQTSFIVVFKMQIEQNSALSRLIIKSPFLFLFFAVLYSVINHFCYIKNISDKLKKTSSIVQVVLIIMIPCFIVDFIFYDNPAIMIHFIFFVLFSVISSRYILKYYFSINQNNDYSSSNYENFYKNYNLTNREKEIVELLINGRSNKEISLTLNISLSTVKNHLHNIFQKTNSLSRWDIMSKIKN
ncbi:MAG TPA: helix-turn-helix transcriptional regulator [Spirochaetota bacterium]|nr:helix-turn-helix transcriptional regulator [Spirochaetota bacterium]